VALGSAAERPRSATPPRLSPCSAEILSASLQRSRVKEVANYREGTILAGMQASFEPYRKKHASRDPNLANKEFDDELRQLTSSEGLNELAPPPCAAAKTGTPPRKERRRNPRNIYGSLHQPTYHSPSNFCLMSDFNVVACPTPT
jgi:hypothetical protein